jgi:glutathione S-transferase
MRALRRQALGDGFLDLLVLARNERLREEPSEVHLKSAAVRGAAVLDSLEREAEALTASTLSIGHIAIGCALSYLDFRFADQDWRKDHARLADWHAGFSARPSVQATHPVDDS